MSDNRMVVTAVVVTYNSAGEIGNLLKVKL